MELERKIGLERCSEYEDKGEKSPSIPLFQRGRGKRGNDKVEAENDRLLNRSDLRPEFCHYRDEGCELAESCLSCPFTKCIYDELGGKQRWRMRKRSKEISRLHYKEGKSVKEIAAMFGISQRTVQRALKASKCHSEERRDEESGR